MEFKDITEMRYTSDHEWIGINKERNLGKVGITAFAAKQLGDVVFVELPEVNSNLSKGDEAAVVESVKAASEVYSPVSGKIGSVNPNLEERPEQVNNDPQGAGGHFFTIGIDDSSELDELMDEAKYKVYCADL